ncbi:copper resistance CopC family protein [Mycetocola sp. 2940]|uniref:copper resistance CopC family protein n=1 Tax=Mycetocola sp. 2940 TaxID=3156452 RepID=UPI003397CB8C
MNLRTLIGLGGIAGIALAALVGTAPAQAHNAFVSSTPVAGSVVTEQPGLFVITTSDALLDLGLDSSRTYLQVRGPGAAQLYYGDGCATVDGASITMPVQLGEPGEYTVAWGVVSADGHPITSADPGASDIAFTWQPADGQELGGGYSAPPTCGEAPAEGETPAPDESAAPAAPAAPAETATSTPAADTDEASTAAADILWIGAGLGVLVLAAAVILLVARSRTRSADGADTASGPGDPPVAP